MGLCGSSTCGCGVTSSASTATAINGYVPTIGVTGSGVSGDPYDLTLNTNWANEVASHIADTDIHGTGVVAYVQGTTSQSSISSETDLTSMSVTWTASSGRVYKVTGYVGYVSQVTSTGQQSLRLTDGSNTLQNRSVQHVDASQNTFHQIVHYETGLSGSVTRKLRLSTTAGTCGTSPAATAPQILMVEDVGPTI